MGYFYALAAAISWGVMYSIEQRILNTMSPFILLMVNSILYVFFLLPMLWWDKSFFKEFTHITKQNYLFIFMAVVIGIIGNLCIYASIKSIGSSRASVLEIVYPMFVILFSYLFFRTQLNWLFFVGAAFIIVGATIIIKFS